MNGTLKGWDQNAPTETLTAQASAIAATTAHAASGVSTPSTSMIPPSVSAVVTMNARELGQPPPAGLHEVDSGAEIKGLDQAGLNHRRANADPQDQQAGVGQRGGDRCVHCGLLSCSFDSPAL